MADTMRSKTDSDMAEPPGGGRQDHETMRAAAQRTLSGPASNDTLAAIGSLNVPGGEPHPELVDSGGASHGAATHEPIPGERDATTLTHREPGAMSGQFAGADIPSTPPDRWMDEQTAYEHAKEGGGAAARRKKP